MNLRLLIRFGQLWLAVGIAAAFAVAALPPSAFGHDADSPTSFVALAGSAHGAVIERYSLRDGRRLGVLARVPQIRSTSEQSYVSNPHRMRDGRYLITISHDLNCRAGAWSECVPIWDSCASRVETFNPSSEKFRLSFIEPGRWLVLDAVPSPDGQRVALLERACTPGNRGRIVIRDLHTSAKRVAVGNVGTCSAPSGLAWSLDGSRIAFLRGNFSETIQSGGCSEAGVSVQRHSSPSSWKLTKPERGCGFSSAAFDRTGMVSVEECGRTGTPGITKLLQHDRHGHVVRRFVLPPGSGYEQTEVAHDPRADTVLVSVSTGPVNVVYALKGRRLPLIGLYKHRVLAEP
jgi:dipeptidyl aminopeptidase/acylaminoacyl peptidase